MTTTAWYKLKKCLPQEQPELWLESMLRRNSGCAYLRQYGSPLCMESYRDQVPLTWYDRLEPWIQRIAAGEDNLLFSGMPIAFERTGGSSGGNKLIPYTTEGLIDFRKALLPWLASVVGRHKITGSAYFSLSPVGRKQEHLAGIPVGLSDLAYIGEEAGGIIAGASAVPPSVATLTDHQQWCEQTLHYLKQARDLQLISAWSPVFLLRLFEGEDTRKQWPDLRVISCWTRGASAGFANELQQLFPHAMIEPKGLMSTEAAITVPDASGKPLLTQAGFFEFRNGDAILPEDELEPGKSYEAVITTNSGLYRYCTGDILQCEGRTHSGKAVLQFAGRRELTSDLVGEKLTDDFVGNCLKEIGGFRMLIPNIAKNGYLLVVDRTCKKPDVENIERKLKHNPQYAYARRLEQLKPLSLLPVNQPWEKYERYQLRQGVRLGDIKPVTLRREYHWETLFRGEV